MDLSLFLGGAIATCGLFTFIVRLMVKGALADFLKELNGTYVRELVYAERQREVERRLSILELNILQDNHV